MVHWHPWLVLFLVCVILTLTEFQAHAWGGLAPLSTRHRWQQDYRVLWGGKDTDETINPVTKASWYAVETFGKVFGQKGADTSAAPSSDRPPQSMQETMARIKADNEREYFLSGKIDKLIYDEQCEFADPFVSFQGRDRFIENLENLGSFITAYSARPLSYEELAEQNAVETKFMVKLQLNLPWKPILAWPWGVRCEIDPATDLIVLHQESWDIEAWEGVKQIFRKPTTQITKQTKRAVDDLTQVRNALQLGGDFAGYTAQYDPKSGVILPVPDHLVPESMLEWGQHPKSLEVVVSEDFAPMDNEETSKLMTRTSLYILPEVGCGIDNLEVQKSGTQEWTLLGMNENCVGLVATPSSPGTTFVETVFPTTQKEQRVRVAIGLRPDEEKVMSIALSFERKFDTQSSQGGRANGGGLDAASVYKWMGESVAKNGSALLEQSPELLDSERAVIRLPLDVAIQCKRESGSFCLVVSQKDNSGFRYEWREGETRNPVCTPL